jgi:hypothetical protein
MGRASVRQRQLRILSGFSDFNHTMGKVDPVTGEFTSQNPFILTPAGLPERAGVGAAPGGVGCLWAISCDGERDEGFGSWSVTHVPGPTPAPAPASLPLAALGAALAAARLRRKCGGLTGNRVIARIEKHA